MKVVFIKSVSFAGTNPFNSLSYAETHVHDLPETKANDCINNGFAIPYEGWEEHPDKPLYIRFPEL